MWCVNRFLLLIHILLIYINAKIFIARPVQFMYFTSENFVSHVSIVPALSRVVIDIDTFTFMMF